MTETQKEVTVYQDTPEVYGYKGPDNVRDGVPLDTNQLLIDYYSDALSIGTDQAKQNLEAGLRPYMETQLNEMTANREVGQLSSFVDAVLTNVSSEEEARSILERMSEETAGFHAYMAPDISLALTNTDRGKKERRYIDRLWAATRIANEEQSRRKKGIHSSLGYFGDMVIGSIFQNIIGGAGELFGVGGGYFEGAGQLNEMADEAVALLRADIDKDTFERKFRGLLDRAADAGYFSDENPFFLNSFITRISEGGSAGLTSKVERVFQIADIGTTVGSGLIRAATFGAARVGEIPANLTQLSSRNAGVKAIVERAKKGEADAVIAESIPSAIRPGKANREYMAGPELTAMRELEARNSVLRALEEHNWGALVDPDIIEANKVKWTEEARDRLKVNPRQELDFDIVTTDTGNIFGRVALGKFGQKPYETRQGAQALATRIGGEVREVLDEGKVRYIVTKDVAIKTDGLARPTDLDEIMSGIVGDFGSTTYRTSADLDGILKRGEASGSKALKTVAVQFKKATKAASKKDKQEVDRIIRILRDEEPWSLRTQPISHTEFIDLYTDVVGHAPRQQAINLYEKMMDLSDAAYFLEADGILKDAVNAGEYMLKLDDLWFRSAPARADELSNAVVWNPKTRTLINADELPEGASVRRIMDDAYKPKGLDGNVRYVLEDGVIQRRLYHTDVLPYNIGGSRKYMDKVRFYVAQETKIKLAGKGKVSAGSRTFMGTRTAVQAEEAARSWNIIVDALNSGVPDMDSVVRAHNAWNPNIESFADLKKFADDYGLDILSPVQVKAAGEPIPAGFSNLDTFEKRFRYDRNVTKGRSSKPLLGFGVGEELPSFDPSIAIMRSVSGAVVRKADEAYLFNAINGWVNAAKTSGAVVNKGELAKRGLKGRAYMEAAELSKLPEGRALATERDTIRRRLEVVSPLVQKESRLMNAFADYVYGKDYTAGKMVDKLLSGDPAGFMRAVVFHTKLGLFAVDQVYVQASQLLSAMAISSLRPDQTMRAVLAVPLLRIALIDNIPEAALKRMARIQTAFTGITPDDFIDLSRWIKETGRNIVDRTVVEENNPAGVARISQVKALRWGTMPFNEGELIARLGAAAINLQELRRAGKAINIFDDKVTAAMFHRQDVMTASMTSASAAQWQRGLLSVPLQFTTFHIRMMEQVFTKGILTPAERIRLATAHLLAWGAAGAPFLGMLADAYGYTQDVDKSSPLWTVVRYGMFDAMADILGADTTISTRLAVGEGLYDLIKKTAENGMVETALGPAGQVGGQIISRSYTLFANAITGKWDHTIYDFDRLASVVSSWDKASKFIMAKRLGYVISRRNETILQDDISNIEAIMIGLGIPLREQTELWTNVEMMQFESSYFKLQTDTAKRIAHRAKRALDSGDLEAAEGFLQDLGALYASVRSLRELREMEKAIKQTDLALSVTQELIRRGKFNAAHNLGELINGVKP